jgi:hypothetical protein
LALRLRDGLGKVSLDKTTADQIQEGVSAARGETSTKELKLKVDFTPYLSKKGWHNKY